MIKINPYGYGNLSYKSNIKNISKNDGTKKSKVSSKTILVLAGAAVTAGLIYGIVRHNTKSIKNSAENLSEIQKLFKEQISQFPTDIDYRKQIIDLAGLRKTELYNLRPLIGPEEYKNIIKEFSDNPIHYMPGKTLLTAVKDDYGLDGVIAKTFRASMHMHTNHSDGKISVSELLDKSAKYADEVFETIKNDPSIKAKNAPFTIAITDHDTLEGCKEAVKIISSDPEKYKNLRVALGVEMTVENRMLGNKLKTPVPIHMTVNCLNPFDEKLNNFFNEKKRHRSELMKKIIEKCSRSEPDFKNTFKLEEAEELYPALKNKVTNINYSMRDYLKKKIIDSGLYKNNSGKLNKSLNNVSDICLSELPKMDLAPVFTDMEEAINLIKQQPYGYMTWAHPALTGIGECLKNNRESLDSMEELF